MRVILVDDDAAGRSQLRGLLRQNGMQVVAEADNGVQGLALSLLLRPDVVITDFDMPRENGLAFTRLLRQRRPLVRIIMLSGGDDPRLALKAVDAGVDAFCPKPVQVQQLLDKIRDLIHRRPLAA